MKLKDANKLKPGDKVRWNDPDGECSRTLTIKSIESKSGFFAIEDVDGFVVEAYARELSETPPKFCRYFVAPVFGCVEPQKLIGPYKTFEAMRKRAVKVERKQSEDDAIFYLVVPANGKPELGSFTDNQLEID